MTRSRSKRPSPETTIRALERCATLDCRGVLLSGDAHGDVCGPGRRKRARRLAADPVPEPPSTNEATS